MRVLVLVTDAFGGRGGIAKFNRDFITALCAHPHCEEVVTIPRVVIDPLEALPPKLTYAIPGRSKFAFIKTVFLSAWRRPRYDLVVCGHLNLLPVAFLAGLLTRAPLLLMIFGIDAWTPHRNPLVKWLARLPSGLISISELTAVRFSAWSRYPKARQYLLPNAIDLTRYHPGEKPAYLLQRYGLNGRRVILTLGRLSADERYKGFDEVMEALPKIRRALPDTVYVIAGEGTDRGRLERKARDLDVANCVIFTGYVREQEKIDHYRLADAYVMPSRGEGFGFVLLEALACGVPVVASSVDGGREALRNGLLGTLVDPDDQDGLVQAIIKTLGQPKGKVPAGLEYFSYQNFEKRVHHIIGQVLEPRANDK